MPKATAIYGFERDPVLSHPPTLSYCIGYLSEIRRDKEVIFCLLVD